MRILVLGASGMLGSAMFRLLSADTQHDVFGSLRSPAALAHFPAHLAPRLLSGFDVENPDAIHQLFSAARPEVVINCVGLIKQLASAEDPLAALPINAILPHRLARLGELVGARVIHISTDCVFSGDQGNYKEADRSDAEGLYGRSKLLGELVNYPGAITLRTSIIGEELNSAHGLVGWFLAQQREIKGYTRAIFSGLPTGELARVINQFVLPNPQLHGLYHVAADPISKYDLLGIVNDVYDRKISIQPNEAVVIDRSLDGTRFAEATGYRAAPWPELVRQMRSFHDRTK